MALLEVRDLLCWNSRTQAKQPWHPSPGNSTWRPNLEYYPDTLKLLPGDIILFRPLAPRVSQKTIQAFQQSAFTHAAIYIGFDHEICEATPKNGVAISSLEDNLEDKCLLLRRVPNLSPDDRNQIALEAGKLRRTPYSFRQIFSLAWQRYRNRNPELPEKLQHGIICSTLCEHAILAGTNGRLSLRHHKTDITTPATLAQPPNSTTSRSPGPNPKPANCYHRHQWL